MIKELSDYLEAWVDGHTVNNPTDIYTDAAYAVIARARAMEKAS